MSSSNPRSSRIKKSVLNNDFGDLNKTKPFNKKKKQIRSKKDNNALDPDYRLQYQKEEVMDIVDSNIDPSEHPDYARLMSELEESRQERLEKIRIWKAQEHDLVLNWFSSQKARAWNEYYLKRKGARTMLTDKAQNELLRIKKEIGQLDKRCGATDEEINRDLSIAKQPYKGSNTPNLVYSDYESRSTTDTPTNEVDVSLPRPDNEISRNSQPLYSDF
ncbi:hypothetical protein G6F56_000686 [Rhizopus delemar]|uniref:Uncharacterized protein n=1 Tax=Rhizopus stolonifer TaxID=4846 RepID=A0A367KUN3_RHIST|nr:hypothetical protein G6F56_000686 [Rhizopus delemar]RCI05830.1 hypothetical protein CU098_011261 [Rhizopus stolonifer]